MIDEDEDSTAEAADDAPTAEASDDAIDVAEVADDGDGDDAAEVDMAPADTAEPGDPGVPSPEELMDDPGPPLTGLQADADAHVEDAVESAEAAGDS